uniref:Partner of Y14 and mago n=1 Tax=Clastoptera arizonana TaxID=38151 RepID=A0A1B6DNZ9_9HEMI
MASADKDESGSFIPATQRPDGTWRKARRVKDGYVPQEEVPLYESKGKQWASRQTNYIPGLDPTLIQAKQQVVERGKVSIPGLILDSEEKKKKKKKKKKATEEKEITKTPKSDTKIENVKVEVKKPIPENLSVNIDPVKRLRNLKKKLREIEALESNMSIKNLDKDQLEKVNRKTEVLSEILAIELSIPA